MWGISAAAGLPVSIPDYILNGSTLADINAAPNQGWFALNAHPCTTLFQVALAGTGLPIGQFFFDVTSDANPLVTPVLAPVTLLLPGDLPQPNSGLALNFVVTFDSVPLVPWMRFRYKRTSGGAAAALNVAVNHT
jgi:hypothetical protein